MTDFEKEQAMAALRAADQQQASAFKRGLYPRRFAVIMAVWAGVLTVAIGIGNSWWLLWWLAGMLGFFYWRNHRGIWVNEIHSRRDLGIVIVCVFAILLIGFAGITGAAEGLSWAPYLAGTLVALLLYGICEFSYRHIWSAGSGDRQ